MSTAFTLFRQSDDLVMPFFFNKPRTLGPTELGLPCSHQELSSVPPHTCSTMVKPNSSWFCGSSLVCGSSDLPTHNKHVQPTADNPRVSSTTAIPRPLFYNRDECHIPQPLFTLFAYLAQQGVRVSDMFRRPGNVAQMKLILERFALGDSVSWEDYNVYTVANVAKKLLLSIPGGLFGPVGEAELLATASHSSCASELIELSSACSTPSQQHSPYRDDSGKSRLSSGGEHKSVTFAIDSGNRPSRTRKSTPLLPWPLTAIRQLQQLYEIGEKRITVCLRILDTLPPSHQQMIILMLGILHQLIFRSASIEDTFSSLVSRAQDCFASDESTPNIPLLTLAEGVVKSVAGTLFHTCSTSVSRVEQAAQVLRSLVVYFPTMGDPITRFYSDAMAGRLPLSVVASHQATIARVHAAKQWTGVDSSVCVLCPNSDHSIYFDQLSVSSRERSPCPTNLLQVASRLFCLGNSPANSTPNHLKSVTKRGARQKQCLRKPWFEVVKPTDYSGQRPKQNELPCHDPTIDRPVGFGVDNRQIVERNQLSPAKSVDATVVKQSNQTSPVDPHLERPVPMLLRRNQSRYRSLRRRQMENLSRRAEWFLGPTVLPVVTLKPAWHSCDSRDHCSNGDGPDELVVQSAVSLLDLGEPVNMTKSGNVITENLIAMPPRILFTASTGELGLPDTGDRSTEIAMRRRDSGRTRLLSVDSSLGETSIGSFISVHSAPPPGWIQGAGSELQYDYPRGKTPPSSSESPSRARSVSPRPSKYRTPCQINIIDCTDPTDEYLVVDDSLERQRRNSAQACLQSHLPSIAEPTHVYSDDL